jgi:sugar fermentation stimulation protein A
MLAGGTYIAVFALSRRRRIQVGRLGFFRFERGLYLYVGSAQRNLSARLARHARRAKPLRWHIDYLSTKAAMIGAMIVPGPLERECELARELGGMYELVMPGFGASDCGCGGHLFYARELWSETLSRYGSRRSLVK